VVPVKNIKSVITPIRMKFKGIIFDFNGVLWWDTHLQEQAWKEYSEQLRGTPFTDEEMSVHVHGRNNKYTLELLTGKELQSNELAKLIQGKESTYKKLCLQQGGNFILSPGAVDLLNFLVNNNIPHTIATASGEDNIRFFFDHLNLDKWFDFNKIVFDDGTLPGKPDPAIYIKAAEKINIKPCDCIVVEDAKSGISAAHNAGIGKIIALGPTEKHDLLLSLPGVSEIISDFTQFRKEEYFGC
jgi:beta-phosphoglucomutase-like phosphatase (HAD superfamily)